MARARVAVVRVKPETILADIRRVCALGGLADALDRSATTIIKNNISWHLMFPSANTTPWQLEGAVLALREAGFRDLVCVENQTVVTSAEKGEVLNKQRPVCEHYHVPIRYNFKPSDMTWTMYDPNSK